MLPAPPPAQYDPMGHVTVAFAAVDPGGQYEPGGAAQTPEHAALVRPATLPSTPAGQS